MKFWYRVTLAGVLSIGVVGNASAQPASRLGAITGEVSLACGAPDNSRVVVYVPGRSFIAITGETEPGAAGSPFQIDAVPPGVYNLRFEKGTSVSDETVLVSPRSTTDVGLVVLGADLLTDPDNCGACGNACDASAPVCSGGACAVCAMGDTRPCGPDVGACVPGIETCDAFGSWGVCLASQGPSPEICSNGIDDDCDGLTDEDACVP